jgi:hypothetical protein
MVLTYLACLRSLNDGLKFFVRCAPYNQFRAEPDIEARRGAVTSPQEPIPAKNCSFCAARDMPLASRNR